MPGLDHGKTWQHGGRAVAPTTASGKPVSFLGPYEGEVVELFDTSVTADDRGTQAKEEERRVGGGPRLMYDTRVAVIGSDDFCKNGVPDGQ